MPVIESLLDTDLYKFTMMQAVLHQHPAAHAEYRFRCRTPGVDLARHIDAISEAIDQLCTLRLSADELEYLRGLRFIKSDFVDFLALFRLQRKYVSLRRSEAEPGAIELEVRGPWLHTILFEVPLLAIVNEVYFRDTHGAPDQADSEVLVGLDQISPQELFARAWEEQFGNPPDEQALDDLDGIGNGLGYAAVLLFVVFYFLYKSLQVRGLSRPVWLAELARLPERLLELCDPAADRARGRGRVGSEPRTQPRPRARAVVGWGGTGPRACVVVGSGGTVRGRR